MSESETPSEASSPWDLGALEAMSSEALLAWAFETFGARAAIGTSFQATGLVLVDQAKRAGRPFRVFTLDTLRLHAETYAHIDAVEKHFGIAVERLQPDPAQVAKMVKQHGEFLFFDSCDKRMWCCKVRKDDVNDRVMQTLDCWITGLRRDQSEERANTRKASISRKYGRPILKLCPLVDWSEDETNRYLAEHGIPVNPLYARGYRTIGCTICTTPVMPWEDARAGRWRWEHQGESKECGLHFETGGGI